MSDVINCPTEAGRGLLFSLIANISSLAFKLVLNVYPYIFSPHIDKMFYKIVLIFYQRDHGRLVLLSNLSCCQNRGNGPQNLLVGQYGLQAGCYPCLIYVYDNEYRN